MDMITAENLGAGDRIRTRKGSGTVEQVIHTESGVTVFTREGWTQGFTYGQRVDGFARPRPSAERDF